MITSMKRWLVISAVLAGSIYGTTYQQFRHFSAGNPRGANDAVSYVQMSHGDYNVNPLHRYRFMVPVLASGLRPVIARAVRDQEEQDKLAFYLVNSLCTLASAVILVLLLEYLGFDIYLALLGAVIFTGSRITVLVTGTPLVDAPYFLAAIVIVYLALSGRVLWLSAVLPILVLVKEPVLLLAFLPLLVPAFRRGVFAGSLAVSVAGFFAARYCLDRIAGPNTFHGDVAGVLGTVSQAWRIVTPSGLHDLQNGFSLFLVLAAMGFVANRRTKTMPDHSVLLALVPVSLMLAVLSGNFGRMIFLSFPVVIPYALVYIREALGTPRRQ